MQPTRTGSKADFSLVTTAPKCNRDAVESPYSKTSQLISHIPQFSSPTNFPFIIEDERIAERARKIMGYDQTLGGWCNPYIVLEKTVATWLTSIEEAIKLSGGLVLEKFIVGSAATFIGGQPLFRAALDLVKDQLHYADVIAISRKINKNTFPFADVDLRVHVGAEHLYAIKHHIDQFEGCKTEIFEQGSVLLVKIGEKLDIILHTTSITDHAINDDSLKVVIPDNEFEGNIVSFSSVNPWNYWLGQTIGIIEPFATDSYRILGRFWTKLSRGKISLGNSERALLPHWVIEVTKHQRITNYFNKLQLKHDPEVPLSNYLWRLRASQAVLKHHPEISLLRQIARGAIDESIPCFLKILFHQMQETDSPIMALHALIEAIAAVFLYKACEKPFEVKLLQHEGTWVLRLRFRGTFGKRDLLVRYDPEAALAELEKVTTAQWKKMGIILNALHDDGFKQREASSSYINQIPQLEKVIPLVKMLQKKGSIISHEDPDFLLEMGKLIFTYYTNNPLVRYRLCWKIVHKCLQKEHFSHAAILIEILKEGGLHPSEGYPSLFIQAFQKGGESDILQATAPFKVEWTTLSTTKKQNRVAKLIEIMNQAEISAPLFFELIALLKVKVFHVNESMLCTILEYEPSKRASWILKEDKEHYTSLRYRTHVSQVIREFQPEWIANFLLSNRFIGNEEEKEQICAFLISKSIPLNQKSKLLDVLNIQNPQLWQEVANEYVCNCRIWPKEYDEKIDSKTILAWKKVLDNLYDTPVVIPLLQAIPPSKSKIRGQLLVNILKNWSPERRVGIQVLELLDPSGKIPWTSIVEHAQNGKEILSALNQVSLPLYSSLFKSFERLDEYFYTNWKQMVLKSCKNSPEKLLKQLMNPVMTSCLLLNRKGTLLLLKMISHLPESLTFILNILEEADEELLYQMIETAAKLNDEGEIGGLIFQKYHHKIKPSKQLAYKLNLGSIARKFHTVEISRDISKFIGEELATPESLPSQEKLEKLIDLGATDWVIAMLSRAPHVLPPSFYKKVISKISTLDKRCHFLEICPLITDELREEWFAIQQHTDLDPFQAIRLLPCAVKLQIAYDKIYPCALTVLSNIRLRSLSSLPPQLFSFLTHFLTQIELKPAYELWNELVKFKEIETIELWNAAFALLQKDKNPPGKFFLNWILSNIPEGGSEKMVALLPDLIKHPHLIPDLRSFIKKETFNGNPVAQKIFWELGLLEHTENFTQEQRFKILNAMIEQNIQINGLTMLIAQLASSKEERHFLLAISALEYFTGIDCPFNILLTPHSAAHIERLKNIILKTDDPDRMTYLNTGLLALQLTHQPSIKNAQLFAVHLNFSWHFLNAHWKTEESFWDLMNIRPFVVLTKDNYHKTFSAFAHKIFSHLDSILFKKEVFSKFIETIISHEESPFIQYYLFIYFIKYSTEHEAIDLILTHMKTIGCFQFIEKSKIETNLFPMNVYLIIKSSFLLLKCEHIFKKWKDLYIKALEIILSENLINEEELEIAYMVITGKVFNAAHISSAVTLLCETPLLSNHIRARELLCDYPHESSTRKVVLSLLKSIPDQDFEELIPHLIFAEGQIDDIIFTIEQILKQKPQSIPRLLDYLNIQFYSLLGKSQKKCAHYYEKIFNILLEHTHNLSEYKKLGVLICNHFEYFVFFKNNFLNHEALIHACPYIPSVLTYLNYLNHQTKKHMLYFKPEYNPQDPPEAYEIMSRNWLHNSFNLYKNETNVDLLKEWLNTARIVIVQSILLNGALKGLAHDIGVIFSFVSKSVAKMDQEYACQWTVSLIEEIRQTIPSSLEIYAEIGQELSAGFTPELISAFPALEAFVMSASKVNTRFCIDALVTFITKCKRDVTILKKAMIQSCGLDYKNSEREKFNHIYIAAIYWIRDILETSSKEEFLESLGFLRNLDSLVTESGGFDSHYKLNIINIFKDEMDKLTDPDVLSEVINYLKWVMKQKSLSKDNNKELGTAFSDYLIFGLFHGENEFNKIKDVCKDKYKDSFFNDIIWLFFYETDTKPVETILKYSTQKTKISWKKSVQHLAEIIEGFIILRPENAAWYQTWLTKALKILSI